jgi:hypothetical protein
MRGITSGAGRSPCNGSSAEVPLYVQIYLLVPIPHHDIIVFLRHIEQELLLVTLSAIVLFF